MGNKSKLASKIIPYFPKHDIYIELFFGAGGIFFNKPRAKHNFLNDLDGDVYNLFMVVQNRLDELIELVELMPIHQDLFNHWTVNKETDEVRKAARFLMLSNMSYLGAAHTLRFSTETANTKLILIKNAKETLKQVSSCAFTNCDFRDVLGKIAFRFDQRTSPPRDDRKRAFIYADPPYLQSSDNYSTSFTETDTADLFHILVESKIRFAISEFPHPFVLEQAEKYGLNVIEIGERQTLKSRNTEILITNYENQTTLF